MVSLRSTALTVGTDVSQCAETTRMALGRGSVSPNWLRNARAGVSVSGRVGAPCDRNRLGMVMTALRASGLAAGLAGSLNVSGRR